MVLQVINMKNKLRGQLFEKWKGIGIQNSKFDNVTNSFMRCVTHADKNESDLFASQVYKSGTQRG